MSGKLLSVLEGSMDCVNLFARTPCGSGPGSFSCVFALPKYQKRAVCSLVEAHANKLNELQKSLLSNICSSNSTCDARRFDPKVFVNCEVQGTPLMKAAVSYQNV